MRTNTLVSVFVIGALILVPSFLLAQQAPPPPPAGTIHIEQKTDIHAVGVITVVQPNQESFHRTDASLDIPKMMPGKYSLFADPPKGTATHIDVFLGDDVIASSDTPQINFTLEDTMTIKVVITYSLTVFGKVGVNSEPTGIPYELHGPDNLLLTGVTPAEYPKMPVGNYSVTYKPGGCPQPSAKSDSLIENGRSDFMIVLSCENFHPQRKEASTSSVTITVNGKTVTFTDVPSDEWFAPYVATITSRNIMSGYSNPAGEPLGKFGPGDEVTIAQLAKIAHTFMNIDETEASGSPVNRKAIGKWFTKFIASAEERGWVIFEDGTVDPTRPATRAEVVTTLLQVLDIPVHWVKGNVFSDVHLNTPHGSEVETAAEAGIIAGSVGADGKLTGEVHPGSPITRAEMAKVLITAFEKYRKTSSSSSL